MTGIVFDIQPYALYDGPGIRTCVFLKGCPLRCLWCHNPESQHHAPEPAHRRDRCRRCGRCVEACPQKAIRLAPHGMVRDGSLCTACGSCARACPEEATEMIGEELEAAEVVRRVARDKPFFDDSGGGVTLTGGEPTFQPGFLLELLRRFRERGIHTALETCGHFAGDLVGLLAGEVDLFLFDVKHISKSRHERATGTSNRHILGNFLNVLDRVGPGRVIPRVPVIPGFNADADSIAAIADFLARARVGGPVHLMAYNGLAGDKYARLGRREPGRPTGNLGEDTRAAVTDAFTTRGMTSVWN